ncbi:hypothetical protein [Thiocapsa rosea]|uniref:Uncharacterized protein n=1 Tax=Thiocapsa rosea TaxID=69360 RepID=A0A495VAJ0_9GAMM|nr:hypothetical protein [Thiocapsa rosea]RKT45760.1 hypothetical protein BDD21_3234 [Thiocapsa rosea]
MTLADADQQLLRDLCEQHGVSLGKVLKLKSDRNVFSICVNNAIRGRSFHLGACPTYVPDWVPRACIGKNETSSGA